MAEPVDPAKVLAAGDALLAVDVQNDFCSGGALAIDDGDAVVTPLNRWLAAARKAGVPVFAARDWHPLGHVSFKERGGPWPPHCVQDTTGAAFHAGLELPGDAVMISKGTRFDHDQYSVFNDTGLARRLREDGIGRLWIGGLALDYCVERTALDARAAGFDVVVIEDATRPITPQGGKTAIGRMQAAGAGFVTTRDVPGDSA